MASVGQAIGHLVDNQNSYSSTPRGAVVQQVKSVVRLVLSAVALILLVARTATEARNFS